MQKFQGAKVPGPIRSGNESSREPEGLGAKVPGSELARVLLADSLQGANWPGREKAVNPVKHGQVQIQYIVLQDYRIGPPPNKS